MPAHRFARIPTRIAFLIISILAILLGSCSQSASPTSMADTAGSNAPEAAPAQPGSRETVSNSKTTSAQAVERLVIKNAKLSVVVSDPPKAMDAITQMADEMGGYVVSANLYQSQLDNGVKVPRASVTIRVPAERLNEALSRIKAQSDRLPLSENIDSQDVTSDYVDQQSRLRNLENTEAQLTKIMDSATKTEDVLQVYNQLVQIREQIETTKGQIKYYEQSAALSAISVDLLANEAVQPLTIGSWQPVGVAKNAVQALIDTMKFLANAAIWVAIFVLPVLLVIYLVFVLPLSLVWRAWRRRRARSKQPVAEA